MKPLVDSSFKLERFKAKGGWTYVRIPRLAAIKAKLSGSKKLRGTIDGYELRKRHLMPMGNGHLFFPVSAEIQKKIGKVAGDSVRIVLYPDLEPLEIPEEMLLCLKDEPQALKFFRSLSESEQNYYVRWIYSAKRETTRVDRLTKTVTRLLRGMKLYDQGMFR